MADDDLEVAYLVDPGVSERRLWKRKALKNVMAVMEDNEEEVSKSQKSSTTKMPMMFCNSRVTVITWKG